MDSAPWLPFLRELGSLALLALVLLYLLREYLPSLTKSHLSELSEQRAEFSRALERQMESFEAHMRQRAQVEDERYARITDCLRKLADTMATHVEAHHPSRDA